jgi:hypothetical protein
MTAGESVFLKVKTGTITKPTVIETNKGELVNKKGG